MALKEGYLLIDHRASPGLTEAEAISSGVDPALVRGGRILESATYTCRHCRGVVVKNPHRIRERAHCQKCNDFICDGCHAKTMDPLYIHLAYDEKVDKTLELAERGMPLGSVLTLT